MKTSDKEKKRFEAWIKDKAHWCLDWHGNDPYDHGLTMDAWSMWQGLVEGFTLKTWFLRKAESIFTKAIKK